MAAVLVAGCGGPARPEPRPRIRIAYPTEPDFGDVPSIAAQRRLESQGYRVERVFYASPELAAAALVRGDADIAHGATRTFLTVAAQGAPVVAVVEDGRNENFLAARRGIRSCADLHDRRVGYSSEGSAAVILLRAYLADDCPGTAPRYVLISGSAARAAALLAGSIDASVLKRAEVVVLGRRAPGRVEVLQDFAKRWPDVLSTAVYVNTVFAAAHRPAVVAYVRELVAAYRAIAGDAMSLAREARNQLGDDEEIDAIAASYVSVRAWPVDGGLIRETIDRTWQFLARDAALGGERPLRPLADRSYLDQALTDLDGARPASGPGPRPGL